MDNLEILKKKIEEMSKNDQLEILKILCKYDTKLNENKSGVFVNLSYLPEQTMNEIYNYIKYVDEQEISLQVVEKQKKEFKDNYFYEES